ncbi:cytochrome P450 2M1-like [Oncorhynchus tshawytscha]|uniref:cytochrome P450 2M1-like n=1 Tax=Oncorhynchus tshawytscha TaxID=74940 RepID=UPI001C3D4FCC|nr:cytochrome P450 2M1-like [Oncorhynchus tshawytscha]
MDLQHVLQTDILSIIMAIAVIILLWKYMGKQRSYGHLPPGPSLIPLLGNLLQMDLKRPDKSYMELSKKYGSVFTVWLGPKPVVVVSGYQAIKEALVDQGEEFNGRANPAITLKLFNEHGVGSSNGQRWKTLRNFSLTSLKNLGIGCRSLEERVQEEAKSLVKAFSEYGGMLFKSVTSVYSTVNPKELLFHTIINLFWSIVLGRRFEYNDPEFQIFYKPVYTYFDMLKSKVSMVW